MMSRSLRRNEISSWEHIENFSKYVRDTEREQKKRLLLGSKTWVKTCHYKLGLQSTRKTSSYQTAKETEVYLGD